MLVGGNLNSQKEEAMTKLRIVKNSSLSVLLLFEKFRLVCLLKESCVLPNLLLIQRVEKRALIGTVKGGEIIERKIGQNQSRFKPSTSK